MSSMGAQGLPAIIPQLALGDPGAWSLVTGPTGSGKTTRWPRMGRRASTTTGRARAPDRGTRSRVIPPRQAGPASTSGGCGYRHRGLSTALRAAICGRDPRGDPDRRRCADAEHASKAALSGRRERRHFVKSTLHTTDAKETVKPASSTSSLRTSRRQVRPRARGPSLRGIVCQRLVPNGRRAGARGWSWRSRSSPPDRGKAEADPDQDRHPSRRHRPRRLRPGCRRSDQHLLQLSSSAGTVSVSARPAWVSTQPPLTSRFMLKRGRASSPSPRRRRVGRCSAVNAKSGQVTPVARGGPSPMPRRSPHLADLDIPRPPRVPPRLNDEGRRRCRYWRRLGAR
jgi:hypothetical protein